MQLQIMTIVVLKRHSGDVSHQNLPPAVPECPYLLFNLTCQENCTGKSKTK